MKTSIWIPGTPATFATKGEIPWKSLMADALPENISGDGIRLEFVLPMGDPWKKIVDVDNLCEPVFSVAINQKGWLGGKRPNMVYWEASKSFGEKPGIEISIVPQEIIQGKNSETIMDAVYEGPLPTGGKSPEIPEWLQTIFHGEKSGTKDHLAASLQFANSKINIGDIATGPVKSIIDCLYPIIGGKSGAPDDWKIDRLRVEKGVGGINGGVRIRIDRILT